MKIMKHTRTWAVLGLAVLVVSCDFGTPTGGGTGGEGLTGVIVDPQGSPVAGAVVRLYPDSTLALARRAENPKADSTVTDAQGRYTFTEIPHGVYNLFAGITRGDSVWAYFAHALRLDRNIDQGAAVIRLSGDITVAINSSQDAPVKGAICRIPASPWRGSTDSLGLCVLRGVAPGSHAVVVNGVGAPIVRSVVVASGKNERVDVVFLPTEDVISLVGLSLSASASDWEFARLNPWAQAIVTITSSVPSDPVLVDTISGFVQPAEPVTQPRVIANEAYILKPLRSWNIAVVMKDAAGNTVLRDSVTVANLRVGETRAVSINLVPRPRPEPPRLASPADGSDSVAASNAVLSWQSALEGTGTVSFYKVQVRSDTSFSAGGGFEATVSSTVTSWKAPALSMRPDGYVTTPGLAPAQRYYWRVTAIGSGVSYSAVRTFVTKPNVPIARTLLEPADQAVGVSVAPVLAWSYIADANDVRYYRIQVASDDLFQTLVVNDSAASPPLSASGFSWTARGLQPSTKYYWRVLAVGALEMASYSTVRSFTTQPVPPPPPVRSLSQPADQATDVPLSPQLSWSVLLDGDDARYFRVQVSTDSLFGSMAVNDSVSTPAFVAGQHAWTVSGLQPVTNYFWRVLAVGDLGSTSYSAVRRFTTENVTVSP